MSASLQPLSLEEFLAWEDGQEERYEFDGVQPVAMTGASFAHAMIVTRLILALGGRLRSGCLPLANDLKVVTERRVRYPDLTIVCGPVAAGADRVSPTVVFEVISPSTALTDRRVKPLDYAEVPSIEAYVVLEQDRPQATVRRRATGWAEEQLEGPGAVLALPEVGVELAIGELHGA
ncbi:MAG TPA: Uma2 family endonuclease [Falsiroseomonas sp.]|jgi:Uma2 family endonuclease|nr:Uma2 family endonuclease [Falsiroseomonas sp.]